MRQMKGCRTVFYPAALLLGCLCFLISVGCAPEDEKTLYKKGRELENKGLLKEAMKVFNEQIKQEPQNSLGYFGRGKVYAQMGYPDDAIKEYSKAVDLNPKMGEAYHMRAVAYFAKFDYIRSWKDAAKAKELGVAMDQTFLSQLREESPKELHQDL